MNTKYNKALERDKLVDELSTELYHFTSDGNLEPSKNWLYSLGMVVCGMSEHEQCSESAFGYFELDRDECLRQFKKFLYYDDSNEENIEAIFAGWESEVTCGGFNAKYFTTFKYSGNGGSGFSVLKDSSSSYLLYVVTSQLSKVVLVRWED